MTSILMYTNESVMLCRLSFSITDRQAYTMLVKELNLTTVKEK